MSCKSTNKKTRRISLSDSHCRWFEGTPLWQSTQLKNSEATTLLSLLDKMNFFTPPSSAPPSKMLTDCQKLTNCQNLPHAPRTAGLQSFSMGKTDNKFGKTHNARKSAWNLHHKGQGKRRIEQEWNERETTWQEKTNI